MNLCNPNSVAWHTYCTLADGRLCYLLCC